MPNVEELKRLLDKVARTSDHFRIEIDYNGKEFKWKIPQHNVTADELIIRNLKQNLKQKS